MATPVIATTSGSFRKTFVSGEIDEKVPNPRFRVGEAA
jgi:hypothetical protein